MGLNWHGVKFLAEMKRDGIEFPRVLTIGRLDLNTTTPKVRAILDKAGVPNSLNDETATESHKYCEPIFEILGASTVESMDASDYESATIVADLNKPIPKELHGKYDLVFDGGTIEHVFDIPQALKNLMQLPKVGGHLIIQTMANNWLGHGFYQFSPELFYRVFTPENGYSVQRVVVHAAYELAQWYDVPDPVAVRGRIEAANNLDGLLITVHAIRTGDVLIFATAPQQSDYSAQWETQKPDTSSSSQTRTAIRQAITWGKRYAPWAVSLKHHALALVPWIPRLLNKRRHRSQRKKFVIKNQPNKFRPG